MSKDKEEKSVDAKLQIEDTEMVPIMSVIASKKREVAAKLVIDKYVKLSFGIGFIPVPAIDLVALTVLQMKMLSEIANIYEQSISRNKLRSTLSVLITGTLPQAAGYSLFIKSIPIIGTALSMTTIPVISAAATYAVGTVFIKHFDSGGTFLNINLPFMSQKTKEVSDNYRKQQSKEQIGISETA